MGESTFLQIFLLFNVFIMGALVAIAIRHAYAHYFPAHHEVEKPHHPHAQKVTLPPAVKERLLEQSQANFQTVLDRSANELQHDLKATAAQLNKHLSSLGTAIASEEMKRYRTSLDKLREETEAAIGGAQSEIVEHQADLKAKLAARQVELEAKLAESMAVEQERLIQQIDTKLADAVASFLMDTLQHDIDLGAQNKYLLAMLDEHKEELKQGVTNGSA